MTSGVPPRMRSESPDNIDVMKRKSEELWHKLDELMISQNALKTELREYRYRADLLTSMNPSVQSLKAESCGLFEDLNSKYGERRPPLRFGGHFTSAVQRVSDHFASQASQPAPLEGLTRARRLATNFLGLFWN